VRSFVRSVFWLLAIFGAIGVLLHLFVFDTWVVPDTDPLTSASMLPTLRPDDRILVLRGKRPKLGELARCASPEPGQSYVIGRVMGEAGDTVEISDGTVSTNGKSLPSRHACPAVTVQHPVLDREVTLQCGVAETGAWSFEYLTSRDYADRHHVARVDPGRVYLVSDNRHMHKDSRDFGTVDASTCEHVVFRLWGASFMNASRRFTLLW
jgi:signal peptidase I